MAAEQEEQLSRMNGAFRRMRFAIALINIEGPMMFFNRLKHKIYSRGIYLGLEKNLDTNSVHVACQIEYCLQLASKEDMEEMVERAKLEGKESLYELIGRRLFYESGFRDCYVARTTDTNELCFVQFMIPLASHDLTDRSFGNGLPRLKEDEVWLENSYTFEKYRRKRVMSSVLVELAEIAGNRGFKRMVTYIHEDNMASIKGCERAGFKVFERVPELRLLFTTRRKYPQRVELIRGAFE